MMPGLFAAVEFGAQSGESFFDELGSPREPHLFVMLLRYFARRHLDQSCVRIEDLSREAQSNNGVSLRYGNYRLRLLKARKGGMPNPGHSQARLSEYRQTQFSESFGQWGDPRLYGPVTLLALWNFDPKKRLVSLSLALPQAGLLGPLSYTDAWIVDVPHPSATIEVAPEAGVSTDDDLDISVADAPILGTAPDVEDDVPMQHPGASGEDRAADEEHRQA